MTMNLPEMKIYPECLQPPANIRCGILQGIQYIDFTRNKTRSLFGKIWLPDSMQDSNLNLTPSKY